MWRHTTVAWRLGGTRGNVEAAELGGVSRLTWVNQKKKREKEVQGKGQKLSWCVFFSGISEWCKWECDHIFRWNVSSPMQKSAWKQWLGVAIWVLGGLWGVGLLFCLKWRSHPQDISWIWRSCHVGLPLRSSRTQSYDSYDSYGCSKRCMAFACETKTAGVWHYFLMFTSILCQVCQHMPYLLFLWLRARIFLASYFGSYPRVRAPLPNKWLCSEMGCSWLYHVIPQFTAIFIGKMMIIYDSP